MSTPETPPTGQPPQPPAEPPAPEQPAPGSLEQERAQLEADRRALQADRDALDAQRRATAGEPTRGGAPALDLSSKGLAERAQAFADWPRQGGTGTPQPWQLDQLGLRNASRELVDQG